MPIIQIEICNWDKYNPRADAKKWAWFRFQVDFFDDEDLDDLPGPHLLVFVYLCCKRAKSPDNIVEIKVRHCAKKARTTVADVSAALRGLADLGLIKVHNNTYVDVRARTDPNVDVRERPNPYPTIRYDTLRNDTDDTIRTDVRKPSASCPPSAEQAPQEEGPFPPKKLVEIWNEHRGPLAAARMTDKRRPKIALRIAEAPEPAYWVDVVQRLAKSPFATGQVKSEKYPGGWHADFEWLITNDNNHVKASEGRYDDKRTRASPSGAKMERGVEVHAGDAVFVKAEDDE